MQKIKTTNPTGKTLFIYEGATKYSNDKTIGDGWEKIMKKHVENTGNGPFLQDSFQHLHLDKPVLQDVDNASELLQNELLKVFDDLPPDTFTNYAQKSKNGNIIQKHGQNTYVVIIGPIGSDPPIIQSPSIDGLPLRLILLENGAVFNAFPN